MKRAKRSKSNGAGAKPRKGKTRVVALPAAQEPEDLDLGKPEPKRRVISRPDGFYWQSFDGGEEAGPFASRAEASEDMLTGSSAGNDDPEALHEAESEIGVNDWIDPDTGGPAEDSVPRIEDH